jgi:8-oxo-dGTP pyrophosphatase MutT (NUDIX family)
VSKISRESPLIIQCDRIEVDVNRLFFHYERVNAAGGVVCRGDEILMIYKNGMWDLPKGFVDNGETFEQAACREISEECGIEGQQLDRKLMETWHTYRYLDRLVLKQSHWYVFHYSGTKNTLPQQEEGILEAVWMSKNQVNTLLDNCYGSVRDVLDYFWHNASN